MCSSILSFELQKCSFSQSRSKFRQKFISTILRVLAPHQRAQSNIRYIAKFNQLSITSEPSVPPLPLICWCNTWTEGELLDDFHDMFQIIKIYFSIIVRNIFWGVFKEIRAWFRKKFISLLITSSILQQYLLYVTTLIPIPFKVSACFPWFCKPWRPPHPNLLT